MIGEQFNYLLLIIYMLGPAKKTEPKQKLRKQKRISTDLMLAFLTGL